VGREIFHCARRIDADRLRSAGRIRDGRPYDRNASDAGILRLTRPDAGRNQQTMRDTACVAGSGNNQFAAIANHHYGAAVLVAGAASATAKAERPLSQQSEPQQAQQQQLPAQPQQPQPPEKRAGLSVPIEPEAVIRPDSSQNSEAAVEFAHFVRASGYRCDSISALAPRPGGFIHL
jgi:hypothetical protein